MTFSKEFLISYNDLSPEFQLEVQNQIISMLKANKQFMERLTESCRLDNMDNVDNRIPDSEFLDITLKSMARDLAENMRQYVSFDFKVRA